MRVISPPACWRYFSDIARIPRPSGKEAGVREYIQRYAQARGFACEVNEVGDVLLRVRPDAPGPVIAVQAHMDMVCVSKPGMAFDFTKDAIRLRRDGDSTKTTRCWIPAVTAGRMALTVLTAATTWLIPARQATAAASRPWPIAPHSVPSYSLRASGAPRHPRHARQLLVGSTRDRRARGAAACAWLRVAPDALLPFAPCAGAAYARGMGGRMPPAGALDSGWLASSATSAVVDPARPRATTNASERPMLRHDEASERPMPGTGQHLLDPSTRALASAGKWRSTAAPSIVVEVSEHHATYGRKENADGA